MNRNGLKMLEIADGWNWFEIAGNGWMLQKII